MQTQWGVVYLCQHGAQLKSIMLSPDIILWDTLTGQSHFVGQGIKFTTMKLARKILLRTMPLFVLGYLLTMSEAYLQSVRVEEIPFREIPQQSVGLLGRNQSKDRRSSGIHLISSLEHQRTFLHLFQVPCT